MTETEEKEAALRARRAHERMHGQSTWIEVSYVPIFNQVRVHDLELGIKTYWDVHMARRRLISFNKQLGERN